MNKNDLEKVYCRLSVLKGRPLRMLNRAGSMVKAYFGDDVETDVWALDAENKLCRDGLGKIYKVKDTLPKYALHAECTSRITCDGKIILAKSDIFLPAQKIASDECFEWENFVWDEMGNNYFDEVTSDLISKSTPDFIVKDVSISKYGDVSIQFENGFVLELFADGSSGSENWRFFENGTESGHLIMSGDGVDSL